MPLLTRSQAKRKSSTPRKSTGGASKNTFQSQRRKASRSPRDPSPSSKSPRRSGVTQSIDMDKRSVTSSPDTRAAKWFKSQPDLGPQQKCNLSPPSSINHLCICLASSILNAKAQLQSRKSLQNSPRKLCPSSAREMIVSLSSPSRKGVSSKSRSVSEEEEEGISEEDNEQNASEDDYEEYDESGDDEDHSRKKKHTKSGSRRKPRGISEHNQKNLRGIMKETTDDAFIVSVARFQPGRRRPRVAWTPKEVLYLCTDDRRPC